MLKNMQTRTKMLLGYAVPILLMIVIAGMVVFNINKLVGTAKWVEHTNQVMAEGGGALAKLLVDMETGERGFLIAGKDEFLEPFNNGINAWKAKKADGLLKDLRLVCKHPPCVHQSGQVHNAFIDLADSLRLLLGCGRDLG